LVSGYAHVFVLLSVVTVTLPCTGPDRVWLQERTAGALWSIAGANIEERLIMAERMSVRLMIDFVGSSSPLLNLIGAEGLQALAAGPLGQHGNITFGGGFPALIQLVRRTPTVGVTVVAGRPVSGFFSQLCIFYLFITFRHSVDMFQMGF